MPTAEFELDPSIFAIGNSRTNRPGDDKLMVKFYMHYVDDPVETEKQGRPMYKDCEFIKILTPGDRNNIIDRPIRPDDKVRFAQQYMLYKQSGENAAVQGTRLEEWPLISKAMVENLKSLGFLTVEQLSQARDDIVLNNPGLMSLRDRARHYLEAAQGNSPLTKLEADLAEQKNQNEALQGQVKALNAKLEELLKVKK